MFLSGQWTLRKFTATQVPSASVINVSVLRAVMCTLEYECMNVFEQFTDASLRIILIRVIS